MKKEEIVGFRAGPEHRKRLAELAQAIGVTPSEVLRLLVESAELVEKIRIVPAATLHVNNKSNET